MIKVKSRASVAVTHIGYTYIILFIGHVLELNDCLVIPNGLKNIISVQLLCNNNYSFKFGNKECLIYLRNKLVGTSSLLNGLYYLNMNDKMNVNAITHKCPRGALNLKQMWHLRLGHLSEARIH